MRIAFIGLGSMGTPMARNLLKAGHAVTVYNRTRQKAEALQADGALIADSPADAIRNTDVLITMLAEDHAVESIIFEPGNVIATLPKSAVHISMSTISVDLSIRMAEAHRDRGQHYVSATVLGRPDAAAAAKLFVMAAGEPAQIKRCQPLFNVLGQKTLIIGEDAPAANVVKLAVNFMLTAVIESMAEAFTLVRKHGLESNAFLDILTGTIFSAPVFQTYGEAVASDKFEPVGFKLPLGLKDNRLLLAAAEKAAAPMPLASLIHDRFISALAHGFGEMDWSAIARVSYRQAGL
jgi:3-hydroxyisobutyrate dehydrogenase-like beta-hydroxyacid dehydrogenase